MLNPTNADYLKASELYNIVPVWEELRIDLETPISIYLKTATDKSYLLESVEGGEQLARYSFIGLDPFLIFKARDRQIEINENGRCRLETGDPLIKLRELTAGLNVGPIPAEPRFFGGAVGYFGYDLIRHREKLPLSTIDDLELPDCCFIFARTVLIYDHVRRSLKIIVLIPRGNDPNMAYEEAVAIIEQIKARIRNGLVAEHINEKQLKSDNPPVSSQVKSNITRSEFIDKVCQAKEYIKAGDIFQVVLSQRFENKTQVDPFEVYRVLRTVNPSPYLFYLNFSDVQIVGSSPEMLVRVENGLVETHPIAGTRPRGSNSAEDGILAQELSTDPKELAEHLMLVDLGRNDLGRVCEYGTVKVTRFKEIERYSHVMHLVSTVEGQLEPGYDAYETLMACFPAGTVSGAPKIRAMEIIEELEPNRRGLYAGAIGYLSFNGNLDSCITIRTIVFKAGTAYIQTGAGIVADSDPEKEYQETLNKAKALFQALSQAEGG